VRSCRSRETDRTDRPLATLVYQPVRASILLFALAFAAGFVTERAFDEGRDGLARQAANGAPRGRLSPAAPRLIG
jgi:hypothetical protein